MLLIKTYLDTSKILHAGIGLFAGEFISKGTIVWKFDEGIDMLFTDEEFSNAPETKKEQIKKHAYYDGKLKVWVLCADDGRFFNHSDNPNCREEKDSKYFQGRTITTKDIKRGEEMTCDYFEFDARAKEKLENKK